MKKEKIILICAAAVCVLSLIVMSAVLLIQSHRESSFTPPAFESSAISGSLELPEESAPAMERYWENPAFCVRESPCRLFP